MTLRKVFMAVAGVLGFLIVLLIAWLLTTSRSVIWSFTESGTPSTIPSIAIFNPFRERKSEAEVERFMSLLKGNECEKAVESLRSHRNFKDLCDRESLNKLEDWRLSYRQDIEGSVYLYYRVRRAPDSAYTGEMQFELKKEADGWRVTNIEAIY